MLYISEDGGLLGHFIPHLVLTMYNMNDTLFSSCKHTSKSMCTRNEYNLCKKFTLLMVRVGCLFNIVIDYTGVKF